jgi:hypothetical protein
VSEPVEPQDPAERDDKFIVGVCPMGCGETLFLGDGGHVTCSFEQCPDRTAAGMLLSAAAAQQRQQEESAQAADRFKLEGRVEALENLVRMLLVQLKGSWWLKAAAAYNSLHRMVNEPEEERREG